MRFGIKTVLIDQYSEITEILKHLEEKYKQRTVFISGAAYEYGDFDRKQAENFIFSLSKDISQEGFRIVSGFGLGVGSAVITGVLEHLYMSGGRLDNDQLILRPFPQEQIGKQSLNKIWCDYRSDMIRHAGIAIFMFGNKLQNGKTIESDGVIKEFEIAKEKGLFLIPIGITGYAANTIYNRLDTEGYFKKSSIPKEVREKLKTLNNANKSISEIKTTVVEIINHLYKKK